MTSPSQIPVSLEALRQRKLSSESAWLLSLASRLAGESSEAAGETLAAWGFESGEFFSEGRTKGFLAATSEVILIAFSVDNDVIRGVEAAVVDRPNGEVNAAAHVAFEEVAKLIRTALSILKPEGKALWLTGHGLGGAVAIIAAAELEAEFTVAGIHTYNPSCVGKIQFADWFDGAFLGRSYRFEATGDRIFSVPPGFRQVQQLVRLDFGDAEEMATEGGAAPGRSLDRYIDRLQAQVETERLKRRDTTATRGGDARPVSPTN
jgi:hypothetical protein